MARAEADPQCFAHAVLPLAHTVARSVTETVKRACREVATERCVDSPKIIEVPVVVEHCRPATRVTCADADVESRLPKTTCEAAVNTTTSHIST